MKVETLKLFQIRKSVRFQKQLKWGEIQWHSK